MKTVFVLTLNDILGIAALGLVIAVWLAALFINWRKDRSTRK